MTPRLPLEVMEQIIDDVARNRNNLSSIRACALVCHSFLPLCTKHIFASVTLNAPACPTSDDLNHLLSNSPHLAVYIRELGYHVSKKEFVAKRLPWLLAMFKKFVKLQELIISYSSAARDNGLDWMSSSKVLLPLLHLPTLTSIGLSSFSNFSLADLAGCVNLKDLWIESLEFSNGVGKFLEALPPTPVMLEKFAIDEGNATPAHWRQLCHARRPDGKPIIDFSSLKTLTARFARLDSMTELFEMWRNLHKIKLSSMPLYSLPHSSSIRWC